MKLTYVGVWSVTRMYMLVALTLGFLFGIAAGVFFGFYPEAAIAEGLPAVNPWLWLAVLPFLYALYFGIFGFVAGALSAWFYNLYAKLVGGVSLTFEKEKGK